MQQRQLCSLLAASPPYRALSGKCPLTARKVCWAQGALAAAWRRRLAAGDPRVRAASFLQAPLAQPRPGPLLLAPLPRPQFPPATEGAIACMFTWTNGLEILGPTACDVRRREAEAGWAAQAAGAEAAPSPSL